MVSTFQTQRDLNGTVLTYPCARGEGILLGERVKEAFRDKIMSDPASCVFDNELD